MATVITHLGLDDRDIRSLTSIFNLSQELKTNYTMIGTEKRRTPGRLADVLLINGDDAEAMKIWGVLENASKNTTPVIISSTKDDFGERHVLRRPCSPGKLINVLEAIAVS